MVRFDSCDPYCWDIQGKDLITTSLSFKATEPSENITNIG